jgi:uncharacterized membrane protein YdjX (TVP38/TMEM64 family)
MNAINAEANTLTTQPSQASPNSQPIWRKITKLIGVGLALGALLVLGRELGRHVPTFVAWVEGLGYWGPVVYIIGYAAATIAFIPGLILSIAAGAIFGIFKGTLIVCIGATLGSCGAFLIARYLARESIERRLEGSPRFKSIDRAVAKEGLKIVFLLRLSPIFPYNLMNYGLGLTSVSLHHYAIASIGMIPGTFLYAYSGKAHGTVAAAAGGAASSGGAGQTALLIVGLAATAVVTAFVTRLARRALKEDVEDA